MNQHDATCRIDQIQCFHIFVAGEFDNVCAPGSCVNFDLVSALSKKRRHAEDSGGALPDLYGDQVLARCEGRVVELLQKRRRAVNFDYVECGTPEIETEKRRMDQGLDTNGRRVLGNRNWRACIAPQNRDQHQKGVGR